MTVPAPTTATVATAKPAASEAPVPPAKKSATKEEAKKAAAVAAAPASSAPLKSDLPVSKSKWERLADLTKLYVNDQITPQEYHKRRAEIVAEP